MKQHIPTIAVATVASIALAFQSPAPPQVAGAHVLSLAGSVSSGRIAAEDMVNVVIADFGVPPYVSSYTVPLGRRLVILSTAGQPIFDGVLTSGNWSVTFQPYYQVGEVPNSLNAYDRPHAGVVGYVVEPGTVITAQSSVFSFVGYLEDV